MKNKIILLIVFSFLFVSFANAIDISDCSSLEQYKSEILGQQIPDKVPFANEIINIYVGEQILGNIQIEEKKIKDFACAENEDATYKVEIIDYVVLNDFTSADNFLEVYQEKTKSGEIEVKGIGFGKKIKLGFVKIALKFF